MERALHFRIPRGGQGAQARAMPSISRCDRWTVFSPKDGVPETGLLPRNCLFRSQPQQRREVPGVLDDYAFTVVACLDAYEATADLSYFKFAKRSRMRWWSHFFDPVSGGFFDTGETYGRRESPWRTGHPAQAISGFSHSRRKFCGRDSLASASRASPMTRGYRDKAEQTIEIIWQAWPGSTEYLPPLMELRPCTCCIHTLRLSWLETTNWLGDFTTQP